MTATNTLADIAMNMGNILAVTQKITKARALSGIAREKICGRHIKIAAELEELVLRVYLPQQEAFASHDRSITMAVSGRGAKIVDEAMLSMFILLKDTISNEKKITASVSRVIARATETNELMTRTETEYLHNLSVLNNVVASMKSSKRNYFLSRQTLTNAATTIPAEQLYEMDIVVTIFGDDDRDGNSAEDAEDIEQPEEETEAKIPIATLIKKPTHGAPRKAPLANASAAGDYGLFFEKKYINNMLRIHAIIRRSGFSEISMDDKRMLFEWFVSCTQNIESKIKNCRLHIAKLRTCFQHFEKLTADFNAKLDSLEKSVEYQHRVHLIDT